jgi:hypothetical protein
LRPFFALRAASGILLVISFYMFTYNVFGTILTRRRQVVPEVPVVPVTAAPSAQTAPSGATD